MKKRLIYILFGFISIFIFQENVLAKEVLKECKYTSYMAITDEGEMVSDGTYSGNVITFVLYDDLSYKVSGEPAGSEDILNWGKDTKYFDNIKANQCMDYIVVMNFTFWGGLDYYGVNESDLLEKGTVAANGDMQFNKVYVFKNDEKGDNDLGVYYCNYPEGGYTIGVNREKKELTISSSGNGLNGKFHFITQSVVDTWFSKDRGTDECLPTVACYDKILASGDIQYYVFNDSMEASVEGYKNCKVEECTGTDCNGSEYSCTTYNKYINEIDSLYSQIKSASGDTKDLYKSVHEKEKRLGTLCNGVMSSYDYAENCVKACVHVDSDIAAIKDKYNINRGESSNANCALSSRLANWIMKIINWMRYIVPVLLILLSILDYIKAIAADSEDEVKKVTSKFVKRLIVGVVIFLVPLALQFLLGIFGIDANNFCL